MENQKDGSWFICTVARESFKNWDICKEISAWGILSGGRSVNLELVKKGDFLLVFAATRGFISVAQVTGPIKCPMTREEVPWAGGLYRYGALVPFKIIIELDDPLKVSITKMVFDGTAIHTSRLQKGFSMISPDDGKFLYDSMQKSKKLKITKEDKR